MVGMSDVVNGLLYISTIPDTYRKIMNWRQHLIFSPELPPISPESEDLIKK